MIFRRPGMPPKPSVSAICSRLILLAAISSLFAGSATAQQSQQQLKVVDQIWGFDGRVQPGQFNPLSLLLDNQTEEPIDATATLQQIQGMLNPTGGKCMQKIFIAPTARRWIQFYPYVGDGRQTEWRLALDGKKLVDIAQSRSAMKLPTEDKEQPPQVVILDRANRVTTLPSTVKHMPENIFPPYATATFGLHTVFLDHVPDWELPRQDAFMSWLKLGGRLQILHDSRGEFPRFGGSMVDLNHPLEEFTIEGGMITRTPIQRSGVTAQIVRRAMVVDVLKGEDEDLEKQIQEQLADQGQGIGAFVETEPSSIDETLFRQMRELTLPDHAWWLIFLLALCYIGLIFPGCFIMSKKKHLHFLATYGAIVGLSVVFSALFLFIGRRGYGETTNLQTLAVARAEGDTHWNMLQWNAMFVTTGDNYRASALDQQAVISTAEHQDQSDAVYTSGNSAEITMRIPPFSSQTFMTRRRVAAKPWTLQVQQLNIQGGELINLRISTGDGFPATKGTTYLALVGRRVYEMIYDRKTKTLKELGKKKSLAQFCQPSYADDYMNPYVAQPKPEQRSEQQIFYDDAIRMLLQRSLLDDLVSKAAKFELPADRVRLFVYAQVTDEYQMDISSNLRSTGRVLFCKDIFLQKPSAETP